MRPNFDPRRTKIDVKNEVEERRLLKIVLEPSWVDLGSSWVPSWGQNRAVAAAALVFLKIDLLKKTRAQEATLAELSPIWVPKREPKWSPRGSQNGAKKEKKNEVKLGEVKSAERRMRVKWR